MPSGQPVGDRVTWSDAEEKHLLLLILAQANPQKLDWPAISERFGRGLTASAASQKYSKIKKRDKDIFEGSGAVSTPTGPKAKAVVNRTPKSTGSKRRKAAGVEYNDLEEEEDEDDEIQTPSKKVKKEHATMYAGSEESGFNGEF